MTDVTILKDKINELVAYAIDKLELQPADVNYVRNSLLDLFNLQAPGKPVKSYGDFQTEIIDPIVQYAIDTNMITPDQNILFETKLLSKLIPFPSATNTRFYEIADKDGIEAATNWLFEMGKNTNYIRMPDINKNLKWEHQGKLGRIDITINLSKPEKDPKQIALAKLQPKSGYPSCMLCPENVGYAGHMNHPARQTLRMIPIKLNNEPWNLQFSPYQYYYQHVIALSSEHRPMCVTPDAFARLMDFVDLFPHYFLGSNAALPIVGGSILTHDHYQGGAKVLPMFKVGDRKVYKSDNHPTTKISIVDWYNSVVRVSGKNRAEVYDLACKVLNKWTEWTDASVDIIANTGEPHNAITPIVRNENGTYVFDMILRNNRTDEAHPYGIFHAAEELHNIKKEGIGIIEVMGLFILPGRLKKELEGVKQYLTGERIYNEKELSDPENPLTKHAHAIKQLIDANPGKHENKDAEIIVMNYINETCEKILECTGVFKNDEKGQNAFDKFMKEGLNLKD